MKLTSIPVLYVAILWFLLLPHIASAQTPYVRGFTSYSTGGCVGRNELGATDESLQECADRCKAEPTCVSFEYPKSGTTCKLSTSCDRFSYTVNDPNDPINWFLRIPVIDGYDISAYGGCVGRNELPGAEGVSAQACADGCTAEPTCISFEYSKNPDEKVCRRSTTCNFGFSIQDIDDGNYLFVKSTTCEDPALNIVPEYHSSRAAMSADGNVAAFIENTDHISNVHIFAKTAEGTAARTIVLGEFPCDTIRNSAAFDIDHMICVDTLHEPGCTGVDKVFVLNVELKNKEGHRTKAESLTDAFDMIVAEPRTLAIDSCLSSVLPFFGPTYIGASDAGAEGDFYWESENVQFWTGGKDGSTVDSSYTKWMKYEPNNSGGGQEEHCVTLDFSGWNDVNCESSYMALYENRNHYPHSPYHSIALSADGKTLAAGASGVGKVLVFGMSADGGTDITDLTQLGSFDFPSTDNGHSIAVSDDGQIVAMAAPAHKDADNNEIGAVRVYKKVASTGDWAQLGINPILGSVDNRIAFNELGRPGALTMAQKGNDLYVAITGQGSKGDSDGGNLRVYKFSGDLENSDSNRYGEWVQEGTTIYSEDKDGSSTLVADISVSSDGNIIVALGSAQADGFDNVRNAINNSGRVRIYLRCSRSWEQLGNTITGTNADEELGRTLRLSRDGTMLAISSGQDYYQLYHLDATDSTNLEWSLKNQGSFDSESISFALGMSADGRTILVADGDRIKINDMSSCLADATNTIPDVCPTDTDNDGVPDYLDQCPDEGGFVLANGCPADSDSDGVKDCVSTSSDASCHSTTEKSTVLDLDVCCDIERDFCPDTPTGAKVYTQDTTITKSNGDKELVQAGCPYDTDLDLVLDGLDRCPGTTDEELQLAQSQTDATSSKISMDARGCLTLSPLMWESKFIEGSPKISTKNEIPHLDMVFAVDKDLYRIANARGYPSLVDIQVMDASCINAFDDLTDTGVKRLSPTLSIDDKGPFTGELPTDSAPITVGLDFNAEKLFGSKVWTNEPNGVASVDFCLRFSVLTYADVSDAKTAEAVTHKNIKASILIDTEQDFSVIGTKIKLEEADTAEETIDITYPLAACRCGDDDACVDSNLELSQSDLLKICIRFASDSSVPLPPDFVKMFDIKSFTCSQGRTSMQPIVNFEPEGVEGQLTTVQTRNIAPDPILESGYSYGADDRMIVVTSRLLSSFFGPKELSVDCTGTVVYEFSAGFGISANITGDASRRLLSQNSISFTTEQKIRRVIEDAEAEAESESEFAVNVLLAKANQGIDGERRFGIGAIAGFAVASVAAAVFVGAAGAVVAAGGPSAVMAAGSPEAAMAKILGRPISVEGQPLAEAGGHKTNFCVGSGSSA